MKFYYAMLEVSDENSFDPKYSQFGPENNVI